MLGHNIISALAAATLLPDTTYNVNQVKEGKSSAPPPTHTQAYSHTGSHFLRGLEGLCLNEQNHGMNFALELF